MKTEALLAKLVICLAVAALAAGCAGVQVQSLGTDEAKDKEARGFRYWQPAPFLFVRSDGQGGLTGEIKWLPDTTQKMSARPYSFMAGNDSSLEFTNGVLTSATADIDETAVISSSLGALSKILSATAKGAADAPISSPETVPVPHIYKIVVKGDEIHLLGGAAVGLDGKEVVIKTPMAQEGRTK